MDITNVIQAFIALIAAIITYMVIPLIKSKVSEQKYGELMMWVEIAVSAAEQLYKSGNGDKKKQYVLDFLKGKGITVDDAVIEAYVQQLTKR